MIFIGLGSNIGDTRGHLTQALALLEQQQVQILRASSLYETEPWGYADQDWFLNAVCEVAWAGTPQELLEVLLQTELQLGRRREIHWGPRIIDLDLIEFQGITLQQEHLTLPHPAYPERDFVLVPLAELEPDFVPTGHTQTVSQLAAALPARGLRRIPGHWTPHPTFLP